MSRGLEGRLPDCIAAWMWDVSLDDIELGRLLLHVDDDSLCSVGGVERLSGLHVAAEKGSRFFFRSYLEEDSSHCLVQVVLQGATRAEQGE